MTAPNELRGTTLLARSLAIAGESATAAPESSAAPALEVENVSRLYLVPVARILVPRSTSEVSAAVSSWRGQVAVGGGRYSMGVQIAVRDGLHLDMRQMNGLVWLRPAERAVRLQAGMRWRDLQDLIHPHGLAGKVMQSYSNFTFGGSVSVDCHGPYVGLGPIAHSIRALQLVTADCTVLELGPRAQPEMLAAAIGGYGALVVVTEVELDLVSNTRIPRSVTSVSLPDYVEHFRQSVLTDPTAVLHNADLLPPRFDPRFASPGMV